jgi:3-deoxy-D-manno-octulosonate 8-phosphate phosphatase (KDO 8-P phosphatase)
MNHNDSQSGALPESLLQKVRKVTFLLLDVDGIQTDGRLPFDADGRECKTFHVHDGAGVAYWRRVGHGVGFLSGRDSIPVRKRGEELGVTELHLGRGRKLEVLEEICGRLGLAHDQICYMGDDFLDLPVLQSVGVPITVPMARPEVKEACVYVTKTPAGHGAVREVVELILKAQGRFQEILDASGLPPGGAQP